MVTGFLKTTKVAIFDICGIGLKGLLANYEKYGSLSIHFNKS